MRRRAFDNLILTAAFLLVAANYGFAQAPEAGATQTGAAQNRIVGIVTAIDKNGNQITVKVDGGESVNVITSDKSALLRLPPGETSAQNAARITLTDIALGDRLFARGIPSADGKSMEARQVVVTGSAVATNVAQEGRTGENPRQRGLVGRVTALDPAKKEISVQTRSREAPGPITVSVSDATRLFRYASDSLNIKDAARSAFAELRVGDQLRALGERSSDGTRFAAEEIIAGTLGRTVGQVVAVNPAANELTVKNNQGQTVKVSVGSRSSLRRVTPEAAAAFAASGPARPAGGAGQARQEGRTRERRERGSSPAGEQPRPRAGRGFQDMLEGLPAITVADLKKGDTVFVSGSEGADPAQLTAIMLITGDATFMSRFLQTGPNRGPQNPGLPGDVLGGGVGSAERPTSP